MGFFSGSSKMDMKMDTQVLPEEEDMGYEDLPSLPKPRASTLITEGITLAGRLSGEGVIQVEGIVEGEIELQGSVTVAPTGLVRGPITADVVRVAGRVEGTVTGREHLRLEKTGWIEGDLATASLVVEDGGRFNGRSTMLHSEHSLPRDSGADLQFGPKYKVVDAPQDAPEF